MTTLTKPERKKLEECEQVIHRGRAIFREVGQALATIREQRLYRDSADSFEEYCRKHWQFGRSYLLRLYKREVDEKRALAAAARLRFAEEAGDV